MHKDIPKIAIPSKRKQIKIFSKNGTTMRIETGRRRGVRPRQ